MPCFKQKKLSTGLIVPCGKCEGCQQRRLLTITNRTQLDLSVSGQSIFGTTTCADEHLPRSRDQIQRMVWQAFAKSPYRIFAAGERGDRTHRYHEHFIAFGQGYEYAEQYWQQRWPFGHVHLKIANRGAPNYVAKHFARTYRDYDVMQHYGDGLGQMPVYWPRKPALGCLCLPLLINRYQRKDKQNYIATFHDVEPTIMLDGKTIALPREVKVPLRKALGLPTQSPWRDEINEMRINDALEDEQYQQHRKGKLAAQKQRAEVLAARAQATAYYKDPELQRAAERCAAAIENGTYEPIAIRRKRAKQLKEGREDRNRRLSAAR